MACHGLFMARFGACFGAVYGLITGDCVDYFVGVTHAIMGLEGEGCYYLPL